MRETSHEAACLPVLSLNLRAYCYKLRPLERSSQLVANTQTHTTNKEHGIRKRKKEASYLPEQDTTTTNRVSECVNIQRATVFRRLEYMSFVEDNKLQHSWAAILAWWRYRKHTDMDKTEIQKVKRAMEIKKREEYTLLNTCRKHKSRRSSTTSRRPISSIKTIQ